MDTLDELRHEAAKEFLYAHARFCLYDNSDDMHEEERWANTFEWLDRKLPRNQRVGSIIAYIKDNLADDIQKAKSDAANEEDSEWDSTSLCCQFLDEE